MGRLTVNACEIGLPGAVCAMDRAVGVAPLDPPVLHPHDIERLLAEHGGWRGAGDASFRVTDPLGSSGFSRVFRGDGGMFPSPVAIKQFLWDPSGASPAEWPVRLSGTEKWHKPTQKSHAEVGFLVVWGCRP